MTRKDDLKKIGEIAQQIWERAPVVARNRKIKKLLNIIKEKFKDVDNWTRTSRGYRYNNLYLEVPRIISNEIVIYSRLNGFEQEFKINVDDDFVKSFIEFQDRFSSNDDEKRIDAFIEILSDEK